MKPARGLFDLLIDPERLRVAALATVRGKRHRQDAASFLFCREERLEELRAALAAGRWVPRGYELVFVRDPKPRVIARAPIEDRVVHTALVQAMIPALTRSLLPECMACRPGMGTHRAVLRLLGHLRRHRYAVHLDIRAYFPSIDRVRVMTLLSARIRDDHFLAVVQRVLDVGATLYADPDLRRFGRLDPDWPPPGRGLPIGAYTSQVFAAWLYLDAFDHFVKRQLKVPGYVRYVDDIFLFGPSRAALREWRAEASTWLDRERGLRLKHPIARILSCRGSLDALGYRIRRDAVVPLPGVLSRLEARTRGQLRGPEGPETEDRYARSLAASLGVWTFGAEVGPEWRCRRRHVLPTLDHADLDTQIEGAGAVDPTTLPTFDTLSII